MVVGARAFGVGCEHEVPQEDGGKRQNAVFVGLKCTYYNEDSFGSDGLEDVGRVVVVGLEWYFGAEKEEETAEKIVERTLRE